MPERLRTRYNYPCPGCFLLAGFEVTTIGRIWGDHRGEVTGVPIDTDSDDPAALRLLTDEQLKAVADKCLNEDIMAINEATAQAIELQGLYWDSLRDIERLIGFDLDDTDALSDVTFSSIAEAKEHYSNFKEKCVD